MKTKKLYFNDWLAKKLKNPGFKEGYEEASVRARLAVRISELRREMKLSQTQLADKLHTTQQVISDIETYKNTNITLLTLQKIARALDRRLILELR